MLDFDSFDKVSSVICKPTPTLTVKHVVSLKRTNPVNNKLLPYMYHYDTWDSLFLVLSKKKYDYNTK